MAVENKRMQQRHGTYAQFQSEISDFLPYEFINVSSGDPNSSDGKSLYYQPDTGNPKRILTDTDDTALYHIDVTTTNPTYSVTKSNTIYLNGRVDGQQGIIITGATKLYQVYLGASTGRFLYRAYSGGDDYSDWIPYARAQITNQNKSRTDLIPSIKAVVDYISSQLSVINTDISNINTDLDNMDRDIGEIEQELLQMEDTSNKISIIDPNSATDTEYPSARAVVNYINSILNN